MTQQPPPFPGSAPGAGLPTFTCPKCHGQMRTFDRNGVHVEQCGNCRGIFLDFGELEHIGQMEANFVQRPPAQSYGPGWGKHGDHRYRKRGFGSMFFSS